MTTTLKWRLGKLPTVAELQELVKDKIITQEEVRGILFNQETEEDRDKDSLKQEIKFLRELVEKLSSKRDVIQVIKSYDYSYPWYNTYVNWCSVGNNNALSGTDSTTYSGSPSLATTLVATSGGIYTNEHNDFSKIETF